MSRPRKHRTGLPKYCYRDKRGKLYMLRPEREFQNLGMRIENPRVGGSIPSPATIFQWVRVARR